MTTERFAASGVLRHFGCGHVWSGVVMSRAKSIQMSKHLPDVTRDRDAAKKETTLRQDEWCRTYAGVQLRFRGDVGTLFAPRCLHIRPP